jgi:hypothetical protein
VPATKSFRLAADQLYDSTTVWKKQVEYTLKKLLANWSHEIIGR